MGRQAHKPTLGCFAVVILLCVLIGSGTAGILIALRGSDEPFDDSDMAVLRPEVPDEENAYVFLQDAAATVRWDDDETESVESMIEGTPKPIDFPEQFLQSNQEAVTLVREALDCEQSVWKVYENGGGVEPRKHAVEAVVWALWHDIRANGDPPEQLEYAITVARMGQRRKSCGGPFIEYLRGLRFQVYAYEMICRVTADEELPGDTLLQCVAEMAAMQDDSKAIGDAVRVEYTHAKATIDHELGSQEWQFFAYNEDANRRAMLREYRTLIDSADGYFCDVVIPPNRSDSHTVVMVLRGNMLGDFLSGLLVPLMENHFKGLAYHRSYNSAVQVLLALKVYHMSNGDLPDSLDALVPEFFDELPRDWFDGGPIKYNREKAIVYCVGSDLQDQGGGDPEEKWGASEDPSWAIPFATTVEQP